MVSEKFAVSTVVSLGAPHGAAFESHDARCVLLFPILPLSPVFAGSLGIGELRASASHGFGSGLLPTAAPAGGKFLLFPKPQFFHL